MKLWVVLLICGLAVAQGRSLLEEEGGHQGPKSPKYKVIATKGASEVREYENGEPSHRLARALCVCVCLCDAM